MHNKYNISIHLYFIIPLFFLLVFVIHIILVIKVNVTGVYTITLSTVPLEHSKHVGKSLSINNV